MNPGLPNPSGARAMPIRVPDPRPGTPSSGFWAVLWMLAFISLEALGSETDWARHVEPLLKEHCAECHNPTKAKSDLDLSTLQTILRGGERGTAVVPGHSDQSNLYTFLSADADPHMPPGKRDPLGETEAGLIRKWIQELPLAQLETPETTGDKAATQTPTDDAKPGIAWTPPPDLPPARVVNRFLRLAWKRDQVKPAERVADAAFARRVYLDLAGRIPTAEEAANFAGSLTRNKRARLVRTLLDGDEYPRRMREVFDFVLMSRRGENWEEQRANQKWFAFLEDAFRQNRPWDEVVRELILARPAQPEDRGAVWFLHERQNNAQAVAEAIAPIVFGVQIQCAQCHDHMVVREIKQAHYWGTVAAFNRSKNVDTPDGPAVSESAIGGFTTFANLKKESQPALLTFFNGRQVDEARPAEGDKETDSPDLYLLPPANETEAEGRGRSRRRKQVKADHAAVPRFSRRAAFADAVTHDNPLLARAMVNRIWAILFGRGIVHPVDLMDSKHPPSHPELLDWLARDFEQSGYDVKRLIRTLCGTRAYQLDSRAPSAASADLFARALNKPLAAEQLFQSLLVATGNRPDADGNIAGRSERELRQAFIAQFPDVFPVEYNASLQQAMFLSNSPLFDHLLTPREGNLTERLSALDDARARVRQAFAVISGRSPDRDELRACLAYLQTRTPEAGVKQLLWAMLSSAEFQLNH